MSSVVQDCARGVRKEAIEGDGLLSSYLRG
jgi:hypothetical protein